MNFIRYMNCPLDLSERQTLIYKKLNERCNDYNNMTVFYTSDQLCADIKCINLTPRIINSELKKMIEKGFISVIKKGTKGNPTKYKITKISNLNVTNKNVNSNLNDNKFNEKNNKTVNIEKRNSSLNVKPYNNIEKEKYIKEINTIWSIYLKNDGRMYAEAQIPNLLKEYDFKELYRCVERYAKECEGKDSRFIQGAKRFFTEGYIDYLDANYKIATNFLENINII